MLKCTLDYNFSFTKLSPQQQQVFLDTWPFAKENSHMRKVKKEDGTEVEELQLSEYSIQQQLLSVEQAYELQRNGIQGITVKGIDGTMLTKMNDRGTLTGLNAIDMIEAKVVQIAVSDVGLLLIDEVDWMEDACTQELQTRLEQGWRILAVCPPNAQRRPDYILGRRKVRQE